MIYFRYLKMLVRSQMEYRAATWMTLLGQLFVPFFGILGIYLLFERFGNLKGWTLPEVALCFGVTQAAFAFAECFARGFDLFSAEIKAGNFDRVMLRPRSTVVQVLGANFDLSRLGRMAQGLIVLSLAISWMPVAQTPLRLLVIALMVASGCVIFTGIFIAGAAVCFFTVDGLEVLNIVSYGGREFASYPMSVFAQWAQRFFTFVIPFGCFNYLPLLYITGRAGSFAPLYALMPLVGMLFLLPCLLFWRFGVRHYLSTGS